MDEQTSPAVRRVRRFRIYETLALILAAAILLGYAFSGKGPDLNAAAKDFMGCWERRDADCLFKYMTEEEIEATGVTPEGLQELLDKFVSPRWKDMKPDGKLVLIEERESRYETGGALQRYKNSAGHKETFAVSMLSIRGEAKAAVLSKLFGIAHRIESSAYVSKAVEPWDRSLDYTKHGFALEEQNLPLLNSLQLRGLAYIKFENYGKQPSILDRMTNFFKPVKDAPRDTSVKVVGYYSWADHTQRRKKYWIDYHYKMLDFKEGEEHEHPDMDQYPP